MSHIRGYEPGDDDAIIDICVRTAASGADASGLLADDRLWADVYALPYVKRHPEFAFVIENDEGRAAGYILGAPDTNAFERWFRDSWWPGVSSRYSRHVAAPTVEGTERTTRIISYAEGRGHSPEPFAEDYPAHLHIDLLPELQGAGWGRRIMETFLDALRSEGVPGVHLGVGLDNAGAIAFYPRLGFQKLPSGPGALWFGQTLSPRAVPDTRDA